MYTYKHKYIYTLILTPPACKGKRAKVFTRALLSIVSDSQYLQGKCERPSPLADRDFLYISLRS